MQKRWVRVVLPCMVQLAAAGCSPGDEGASGSQPRTVTIGTSGSGAVNLPLAGASAGTTTPSNSAAGVGAPGPGPSSAGTQAQVAGLGATAAGVGALPPPAAGSGSMVGMLPNTQPPIGGTPAPVPDEPAPGGVEPSMLPAKKGECPTLKNGSMTVTLDGKAMTWSMFMGTPKPGGPLIFFWHGTAGIGSLEAQNFLKEAVQEAKATGGLVAAAETSSDTGSYTDYGVWMSGDANYVDQVVACAIEQLQIDTKRIYTAGYSAGALFAVHLWYARSGYIAGVASYSGGTSIINMAPMQDPRHPPPVVAAHGMKGSDVLVLDFADTTVAWLKDVAAKGAFAVECDDGSSHIDVAKRAAVQGSVWKFFKDHPYGVKPSPYMALPAGWPAYCKINPG